MKKILIKNCTYPHSVARITQDCPYLEINSDGKFVCRHDHKPRVADWEEELFENCSLSNDDFKERVIKMLKEKIEIRQIYMGVKWNTECGIYQDCIFEIEKMEE